MHRNDNDNTLPTPFYSARTVMATPDMSQPDQANQEGVQRQGVFQRRPRFFRSVTSPIPTLRDTDSPDTNPSAYTSLSSSVPHPAMDHSAHHYTTPAPPTTSITTTTTRGPTTTATATSSLGVFHDRAAPRPIRPQVQPLQMDRPQKDAQKRSFSTTSVQSSILPPPPPGAPTTSTPSNQTKSSITEALKEHRWPKGLKLNWMPSFGGNSNNNNNSSSSSSGTSSGRPSPGPDGAPTTSRYSPRLVCFFIFLLYQLWLMIPTKKQGSIRCWWKADSCDGGPMGRMSSMLLRSVRAVTKLATAAEAKGGWLQGRKRGCVCLVGLRGLCVG
ncbi:hypothetical protein B0O80DRAFT_451357 [Mortierella sp. GBAus27b]|nr:hypothetical protein B0O80DRAFT_451357 [Mortierella sp. GBAus27b]